MEYPRTISAKELSAKLGAFVSVKQGEVRNELTLTFENGWLCQSYTSPVAAQLRGGGTFFYPKHDCSKTTNRHVNRFCGMTLPERRKALQNGSAVYVTEC